VSARLSGDDLLRRALGVKGEIDCVMFQEDSRQFVSLIPDDNLWIAVKDNLILSEYERCGVRLSSLSGTVIDAGAHVGLFSLRAGCHASHVVALEPHPVISDLFEFNLKRNNVRNVELLRKALWSSTETIMLHEGRHTAESSVVMSGSRSHAVETITLDDLVERSDPIDLLKLDIEGAEFEVIRRASASTLSRIRAIVGELHLEGREAQQKELVEKLRSVGFRVSVLPPPVYFWKESMSRLIRNWRKLRDHRRLKLLVAAVYTTLALVDRVSVTADPRKSDLAFLYAQREPSPR
jgi:FkbM family methyltransferase